MFMYSVSRCNYVVKQIANFNIFPSMNIERLRQVRELRGLSKRHLARLSGVGEMQIVRYESGANDPSTENLRKLADVLRVSSDYLLGISDDPQGHFGDENLSETEMQMVNTYRRDGWAGVIKLGANFITDKKPE
jgi:transcriptional regulator with XRE-family HTH domain